MSHPTRRDWAWVAATLAFVLLPLAFGGSYVWHKHQWAQNEMNRIAPRYARLEGLQQHAQELDERLAATQQQLAQYVYPADVDATQAGNDAQQRVRSVLGAAGLTVVSSQVLPTKVDQGFERISLVVQVEGELIHLQSALAVIPGLTPVVLIDGINAQISGVQRADRPQRLAVRLSLSVLHVKPV